MRTAIRRATIAAAASFLGLAGHAYAGTSEEALPPEHMIAIIDIDIDIIIIINPKPDGKPKPDEKPKRNGKSKRNG